MLVIVSIRAAQRGLGFNALVVFLNYVWMAFHVFLFCDWMSVFVAHYSRYKIFKHCKKRVDTVIDDDSKVPQPLSWICFSRIIGCLLKCFPEVGDPDDPVVVAKPRLNAHTYLLLVSLLVPANALLFYDGLAFPLYSDEQLQNYNVPELMNSWPTGGNLHVNTVTGEVSDTTGIGFSVNVNATNCYSMESYEYEILAELTDLRYPKQPYCESLLGTVMVNSVEHLATEDSWVQDDDRWDEAFEFSLRLFSSLAGIVAETIQEESDTPFLFFGGMGFWFMKDMTDVFDMYMLTFADVTQLTEGRPVLSGVDAAGFYDSSSFHTYAYFWIWMGYLVVLLRAFNLVGVHPLASVIRCCCKCFCKGSNEQLRMRIDAMLSMCFIEIPYLILRWTAWQQYGVPVSVMAVKNVLGIFDDLRYIGWIRGLKRQKSMEMKAGSIERCLCCCCLRVKRRSRRKS